MASTRLASMALLTLGLVLALAPARPDDPKPTKAAAANSVAVPKDAVAFATVHVAEVWGHRALLPAREARGKLEFAWAVQSLVGLTPTEIERLTAFWPASAPDAPHVVIKGRKPIDPAALVKTLARPGAKETKPTGKVLIAPGAEFAFVLPIDDRTVLLAPKSADPNGLEKLAAGLIPGLAKAAGDHSLAVGIDVRAMAVPPLPFGGPLLEARTAVLTADLGEETAMVKLTGSFPTAAKARAADPILRAKLTELAVWAKAEEKKAEEQVAAGNVYTAPLLEWMSATLKTAKVRVEGTTVVATAEVKLEELVSRVMMAVPDSALAPRGASAAENNFKQIGLAIHSYHDAFGNAPGNSYDKDGKPLLSWRVHILPFIEQDALFRQFKLDEPWDSPNNKPLSQTVIRIYQAPGRPAKQPWETYFRTFVGPKNVKAEYRPWLLEGETKGPKLQEVRDGTSNTIMVVEAAESVPWAKPDELPYDGLMALPKLGGPNGMFVALFGDGSVRTFRRGQIDEVSLRRLIQIQDGEPVNIPLR